jgi:molecular chaperone GrpE
MEDARNTPAAAVEEDVAEEHQEPTPSVPSGEPEAPVAPASPQPEPGSEVTARAEKADEYLELAQRTKADFENYRKRAAREVGAAQERGVIRLAKELLPAVDNLDRALVAVEDSNNGGDLLAGIKLVHAEVLAALARVGVEPFEPTGEPFDPSSQEAVAQQPIDGAQPGTVAEVYQRGYRLGETVIRPARVLVAG